MPNLEQRLDQLEKSQAETDSLVDVIVFRPLLRPGEQAVVESIRSYDGRVWQRNINETVDDFIERAGEEAKATTKGIVRLFSYKERQDANA
jgi:hypothetical protein